MDNLANYESWEEDDASVATGDSQRQGDSEDDGDGRDTAKQNN